MRPPEDYHINPRFKQNKQPRYDNKAAPLKSGALVWQPHVYDLAGMLAKHFGYEYIVDVGCGNAHKLQPYLNDYKVIGLDYGPNIKFCRDNYKGTWIEQNLEEGIDIEIPNSSIIICADVIEHLVEPDWLLNSLVNKGKVKLISTPNRSGLGPPSREHVREWTTEELEMYLSCFFDISWLGLTKSHTKSGFHTSLVIITDEDLPEIPEQWAKK